MTLRIKNANELFSFTNEEQELRVIFAHIPDKGEENDYKTAKEKLMTYFQPQENRRYEVYCFRQTTPYASETINQFHTLLCTLAKN